MTCVWTDPNALWDVQSVDSTGDVGKYTSLTLDAANYPHISYYRASNRNLRYTYKDDSGERHPQTENVDKGWNDEMDVNKYSSLRQYRKYS